MAANEPDKAVKLWMKRVESAEKARKSWEQKYEVVRCREYWAGFQRDDVEDGGGDRKAQVNRIMPTLRSRIPGLYFYYPQAKVVASPAKSDTPFEVVDDQAQLLEDTCNALLRDPRCGLKEQTLISLKEAHWAFGAIEVGYSADFADNPMNKEGAPPLKEDKDTEGVTTAPTAAPVDSLSVGEPAPEASPYKKVVKQEWFWTRRIPPRQILVSAPESALAEENDWIGYWEYMNLEDVKKAPAYKNKADLKGGTTDDKRSESDTDTAAQEVKLYKIWDQRAKCRYVFAEGHDKVLLKQEYERLPLFFLRFEVEPDCFRPIPPIYNWLGSQDEYNDSREFLRMQRKTRVPRYTVDEQGVLPEELKKFEANEPNVWIKRRTNTASDVISPVMQPAMSDSALQSLTLSRQEFDEVTGVGAESRQQASSDTATQAAIMNQRQTINDTFDRQLVATWLGQIARELILLAIDKLTLPRMILMNSDQNSPAFAQDAMRIAQNWQQITAKNLEDANAALRWDVTVDVDSLSPVSEEQKKEAWNQMLAMISNPVVAPLLALSPELLKRTLDLNGVKNGKDQGSIGQALAQQAQMQMQMAMAKAQPPAGAPMPGGGGPPAPPGAPPGPPQMIPGPPEGMVQ